LDPVIIDILRNAKKDKPHIRESIKKHYFDGVDISDNEALYPALSNLLGDGAILNCMHESIRIHASTSSHSVYAYVFGYKGNPSFEFGLFERAREQHIKSSIFKTGVSTADNMVYLFDVPQLGFLFAPKDLEFSREYIRLYADIAANTNPSKSAPTWKPSLNGVVDYYMLDSTEPGEMIGEYRKEENKFWKDIMA